MRGMGGGRGDGMEKEGEDEGIGKEGELDGRG